MARLAVFCDRLPDDPSWKGAYTWEIIRALAESQHEVRVFTTENLEHIELTHPRLTVARPAPSWGVERMPRWAQAVMTFRPEVIHTFALKPSSLWPKLSVWPYLDALCRVLPGVRRFSTFFDAEDLQAAASLDWHRSSDRWTVFSPAASQAARAVFHGRVDVVPMDEVLLPESSDDEFERGYLFVPAPVSEWHDRGANLARLTEALRRDPALNVWINGGWGELGMSERRAGWQTLGDVASRVRLIEAQNLQGFVARTKASSSLWIAALRPDSWRYLLAARIGQQLGRELIGADQLQLDVGSTANSLSRLYLT